MTMQPKQAKVKPTRFDRSGWCSDVDRTYHHYCRFTYEGLRAFLQCPCDCHEGTVVEEGEGENGGPKLAPKSLGKKPVMKPKSPLAPKSR